VEIKALPINGRRAPPNGAGGAAFGANPELFSPLGSVLELIAYRAKSTATIGRLGQAAENKSGVHARHGAHCHIGVATVAGRRPLKPNDRTSSTALNSVSQGHWCDFGFHLNVEGYVCTDSRAPLEKGWLWMIQSIRHAVVKIITEDTRLQQACTDDVLLFGTPKDRLDFYRREIQYETTLLSNRTNCCGPVVPGHCVCIVNGQSQP
jgi:hypothetical protein